LPRDAFHQIAIKHFCIQTLPFLGKIFLVQVVIQLCQALSVVSAHTVIVVDGHVSEVNTGKAPVHSKVDRHQQQVVAEDVNIPGPASNTLMSNLEFNDDNDEDNVDCNDEHWIKVNKLNVKRTSCRRG